MQCSKLFQFFLDARYYFGCVHVASVILSFLSIWTSSIIFNDLEDISYKEGENCCSSKKASKILFGAPYLLSTLIFRAVGMALLICFLQIWSGLVIFGIFFINVLTALAIGDDFHRAFAYAIWSMFVPVGYSRDPSDHLGKLILYARKVAINFFYFQDTKKCL